MDVIIVGGGVVGLCCAYYLQRDGAKVTVVDRGTITDGCSFGNMGYISPSHFTPLASPGIISQGLKWMLRSSSPFYIKPRLDPGLVRWALQFWKSSNAATVEKHIPHLDALLQLSRSQMKELRRDMTIPFPMEEKGCWMLYKLAATGEHEKHLADHAGKLGLRTVICSAQEVQEREPDVEVDVLGGVLYEDDCHVEPRAFMEALKQHLAQHGVRFLIQQDVRSVTVQGGRCRVSLETGSMDAGQEVVANGSWMQRLARTAGVKLLMQPGKGYSVAYDNLPKNLQRPAILVDDRTATTPIGSWLRIGGTMELSGHDDKILPKRVMALYNAFQKYYPKVDLAPPSIDTAWYGYRPVTPDGLPYIGRAQNEAQVIFAGGHAMLGVSAAAGTGLLVAQLASGKQPAIDLSAFHPGRFS